MAGAVGVTGHGDVAAAFVIQGPVTLLAMSSRQLVGQAKTRTPAEKAAWSTGGGDLRENGVAAGDQSSVIADYARIGGVLVRGKVC